MIITILFYLFSIAFANNCNVLVLSGGGSHGAKEAGIVAQLFSQNRSYDVITGVSAGSINAAYIASMEEYYDYNLIRNLWGTLKNEDVYKNILFTNKLSLFSTDNLKTTLTNIFKNRTINKKLLISAVSLLSGTPVLFDKFDNIVDILMSSAAIPLAFPPYHYNNDVFIDGGLMGNIILYPGLDLCPFDSIKSVDIVISTDINDKINEAPSNILSLLPRLISLIRDQVEYSDILHIQKQNCVNSIIVNLLTNKGSSAYNYIDFTHGFDQFDEGFTMTNVNQEQFFICQGFENFLLTK